MQGPSSKKGPRVNEDILDDEIRLIDETGENHGAVAIDKAMSMAKTAGLDLVEISPNATPPVCKILDYGKFKYEAQKKASLARKKQKTVEVKEIKLRPGIEKHDYDVKMRAVNRFLEDGYLNTDTQYQFPALQDERENESSILPHGWGW